MRRKPNFTIWMNRSQWKASEHNRTRPEVADTVPATSILPRQCITSHRGRIQTITPARQNASSHRSARVKSTTAFRALACNAPRSIPKPLHRTRNARSRRQRKQQRIALNPCALAHSETYHVILETERSIHVPSGRKIRDTKCRIGIHG